MQLNELYQILEDSESPEYISVLINSLRHDPVIWSQFMELNQEQMESILKLLQSNSLNPGILGLVAIDPGLPLVYSNNSRLQTAVLEECMTEYEAFLQKHNPPESMEQAAKVAIALIEKRKIVPGWSTIFAEIAKRTLTSESIEFEKIWRTTLALVINLSDEKEAILSDLFGIKVPDQPIGTFLHLILCLSFTNVKKADLIIKTIKDSTPENQEKSLKKLLFLSEKELAQIVAENLLKMYENIDFESSNIGEYWDAREKSLVNASNLQYIAGIAQIAGNIDFAKRLFDISREIVDSFATGLKIQHKSLLKLQGDNGLLHFEKSGCESDDAQIVEELAFAGGFTPGEIESPLTQKAIVALENAKTMNQANNPELALAEFEKSISDNPGEKLFDLVDHSPRFNPSWDPADAISSLLLIGAFKEAADLAHKLLQVNPSSQKINHLAVELFMKTNRVNDALPILQMLCNAGERTDEIYRSLAHCYQSVGRNDLAYQYSKRLLTSESVDDKDACNFAKMAIANDQPREAIEVLCKILERDPENSMALSLTGLAYNSLGETEKAIESLSKAIELTPCDSSPWVTLSDLYFKHSNTQEGIETLRKGLVSLPEDQSIKTSLAKYLMENGSPAEALPLLRELSEKSHKPAIDLLLLKATKTLGLVEFKDLASKLYSQNPNNEKIAAEYAKELITMGRKEEAAQILGPMVNNSTTEKEWVLDYVNAVGGINYHFSGAAKKLPNITLRSLKQMVCDHLQIEPENSLALLLDAELLLQENSYEESNSIFTKLIEKISSVDKNLCERVQAGFAYTSALMLRFEVALAAIKEALELQPDWLGLRKTLAEIYFLKDQSTDAIEEAKNVLGMAPENEANIIWCADFMEKCGKVDEIESVILAGMKKFPESVVLTLRLAQFKLNTGNVQEAKGVADGLKNRISEINSESETLEAATLFDNLDEKESAIEMLTLRSAKAGVIGLFDLSAYCTKKGNYQAAFENLQKIPNDAPFFGIGQCLIADVLARMGEYQNAFDLIHSLTINSLVQPEEAFTNFLPDSWKKLIKSKDPISQLESILSFQLGNPQFSLIRTKNWLEIEPTDVEAKILGVESSLAIGKYSDLPELLDLSKNDNSLDSREHLAALNIEQALNKEQFLEARRLMNEAITEKLGCLSIVAVQLLTVEGNLTDAELKFEEILKSTIITDEQSFVKRVGITRNLIKAGAALRRWDDILILAQAEAKNHPWNMESLLLYLVTFVKALEFQNASKDLGLETHSANPFFQKTNVAEELDWLEKTLGSWNEKEIERWLLRGKLANDPNQSNIRSFALVSPRPDDAAVMVAGLSANRQESTAVQVAKKFDSYPITLYELALCQSKSDPEAAMKTLEKCLKIDSNQPLALALKAVIAEKMDRIDVAVTALEEAIKLWPNEFNWRISAARLWNKLGNLSNRIDHLEEAYQLCPGMVPATLELGNSYLQNGNYENCIKVLEPLSRTEPNHYELWETLADAYFHRGDESSALRAAGRASVINPFSVKPYLLSGKINLKNGEIEKALHYAKLALTRNEKDSESNVFLAKVYLKQGEKQKALSALEKASQCKNATVQTMIDHVELIKEINGTRNTRELITTISEKYPENVDVLKMLAKAQEECGDSTAAEQTAKRALLVNPEQPEMHLFLGEIQTKSGQLDQAIQHFSEAIAQNNGQMDGYLMLSKVYEQQREFTKAIETLNQAIDVNPGDTRSYINAANLFRNSKNYLAAEKMLKKAVEIDPKDLSIRRQLGALLALNLVHQSQEVSSQL